MRGEIIDRTKEIAHKVKGNDWYGQTFVGRMDQSFDIPHSAGLVVQAVRG